MISLQFIFHEEEENTNNVEILLLMSGQAAAPGFLIYLSNGAKRVMDSHKMKETSEEHTSAKIDP